MDVKLIAHTDIEPMTLAQYVAKICYSSKLPQLGNVKLDVKKNLFDPGHHTTLEHFSMTFAIEGIAVGDVTFGLHLAHPFYNTDQRSARFAGEMFTTPDFEAMKAYIKQFWPKLTPTVVNEVMSYVENGANIYDKNLYQAQKVVAKFIKEERPHASNGVIANIPKYAQEQMRMFIPVIFPTALAFTIDIIALVSMYESAWTPGMRYVTAEMARLFVEEFPEVELNFLFNEDRRRKTDWAIIVKGIDNDLTYKPNLYKLETIGNCSNEYVKPTPEIMHPVDNLHFTPEMMNNSILRMMMQIEISVATMGQDQRHRTVSRGMPSFTGGFYIPPVLKKLKLEEVAAGHIKNWVLVSRLVPKTLAMILAPYGAIVSYRKSGSLNAIAHEMCKRLCWNAQEEIYDRARQQRIAIQEKFGDGSDLLKIFQPSCFETGKCGEGDRYCGRDIKLRKEKDKYFPERRI